MNTTNLGASTPFARRWEVPSYSLEPTRVGKPPLAAQLQRWASQVMSRSIAPLLAVVVLALCFFGSAKAEDQDLPPDKWPLTVEATVKDLLTRISPEEKATVKGTKKDDLILYHHGWGTGIRNYYGLWRGNQKLIQSACGEPCHPDDASMVIIEAVWTELQK